MITIYVHKTQARAELDAPVTSGSVGREVQFQFSDDWDGLVKTAVFETNNYKEIAAVPESGTLAIPEDVLAYPDFQLRIGVIGKTAGDATVIPTVYADCGAIKPGASTVPVGTPPTPSQAEQLQAQIDELREQGVGGGSIELDPTLTQSGKAADAKAVGDALAGKQAAGSYVKSVNGTTPDANGNVTVEAGGVSDYPELTNKPKINGVEVSGDKTSADYGIGNPTDEQVATSVEAWLDEHPEATTTVADGSITPNKTSFLLKKKINLYNPAEVTAGKFDDGSTDYVTSGYIAVKKTVYNVPTDRRPWYIQLYNDGVVVKNFTPNTATIDLAEHTEEFDTLRMANYGTTAPSDMMFVEGELPREYIAYDAEENTVATVTDETVKRALDNNAYDYLLKTGFPVASLDFLVGHPCNLCDFSKAEPGYINASNGNVSSYDGVYVTDFIPVEEGATYYGVGTWGSGFYDADKNFVKEYTSQDIVNGSITVPVGEGIAYIRSAGVGEDTVILKGVAATSYIPPTKSFHLVDGYARKDFRAYLMGTLGVRWFAVGDSITQGTGATENYVDTINMDWLYHVTNYGIAGTRLTSTSGNGDGMCERIKTYDETKCDIITVCGGINDKNNGVEIGTMEDTDTATVYGALKDICNTFLTKYAGKRCGFITPLKYTAGETSEVTKAIKEVAAYYNIPVLDMESEFGYLFNYTDDVRTAFTADGLHPNAAGHALMARKIGNWLLTL